MGGAHAPNTCGRGRDSTFLTLLAECHGSNKAAFGALHTAGSWRQNTRRTRLLCESRQLSPHAFDTSVSNGRMTSESSAQGVCKKTRAPINFLSRTAWHCSRRFAYDTKSSRELCPSAFGSYFIAQSAMYSASFSSFCGVLVPLPPPAPNATPFHAGIENRP